MMGRSMRRDLFRSIRNSLGRYLAILAIIALGAGFFAGLRSTKSAMLATAQRYVDDQVLFDFRVLNTYGYTQEAVAALSGAPGVARAEGAVSLDALLRRQDREEDQVFRLHSLTQQVNVVDLQAGRMPQAPNECLADGYFFSQADLGATLTLSQANDPETAEKLAEKELTIVGLCSSPLYMSFERGSTTLGDGTIATFLYLPPEAFLLDGVYTEVALKLDQAYALYAPAYDQALEQAADPLEDLAQTLAQNRYETMQGDARQALADGEAEYQKGLIQYQSEKARAQAQLEEAQAELDEGWSELDRQKKTLDEAEAALAQAQAQADRGSRELSQGEIRLQQEKAKTYAQLADTEAALSQRYQQATDGLRQLKDGLEQVESGLSQLDGGLEQIASGLEQLDSGLRLVNTGLSTAQALLQVVEQGLAAAPEDQGLLAAQAELEQRIADLERQQAELLEQQEQAKAQQTDLQGRRDALAEQAEALSAQKKELEDGLEQIQAGFVQVDAARDQADDQFASAQAKLEASRLELEAGREEIDRGRSELEAGQAQWDQGQSELESAQAEFDAAQAKADRELSQAQKKLDQAKQDLADGRRDLAELQAPDTYVLDRNTNVGYVCFESDADIVAGVSRVFPLFFFLVAALVCITTMTKMVDEERTQIGVMKALGYDSAGIMAKYLAYAGSAALLGCLIGVIVGSIVFPQMIWQAYTILYHFSSRIRLAFDWPLCGVVVVSYTLSMLAVTWFCCRRELRTVPADLIRPKSPRAGKRLLLERLPFWGRVGFLHKVAIRNIFRYHKRLVMMLLGIGGCTALVLTGFGIKDSIAGVVDQQFETVTVYDIAVNFQGDQDQAAQEAFRTQCGSAVREILFLHESVVDVSAGGAVKSSRLIAADGSLEGFVDLHRGSDPVDFPGPGEAVINNGEAEAMGLSVGDRITVRTSDLRTLELTVSGIFDNNVYHYVIVSQETVQAQWGAPAAEATAYLTVNQEQDVHQAAAVVAAQESVLSVSVSQDMRTRVGSTMKSMDAIVVLVVFCAAALAFIVLYNLTNINITERVREIATIKVLGFFPWESASYVFREGLALTGMGCLLGLIGGRFLHAFVMDQIRIDMVHFTSQVAWTSYLWSVGLTFLFACIVDFFLFFKLEAINMAEALKSVE